MALRAAHRSYQSYQTHCQQGTFEHRLMVVNRMRSDCQPTLGWNVIDGAAAISRLLAKSVLTLCFILVTTSMSFSQVACKPFLSIASTKEAQRSTPALPWKWNATVVADNNHCATRSGSFEVDFLRIKENAPDLQFTEKFRWTEGQFDVSMELTSDEAILGFRIGFIAPCVCRQIDQLSVDYHPK